MTHKIWVFDAVTGCAHVAHGKANGQKRPISVPFNLGGESMDLPGDPRAPWVQSVECGCTVTFAREFAPQPERISEKGLAFIKNKEGFVPIPEGDPNSARRLTVGYGHMLTDAEKASGAFQNGISPAEADGLIRRDIKFFERAVSRMVKVPITQQQFDALVSLAYNIGADTLSGFEVIRALNRGDYRRCAEEFLDIDKARNDEGVLEALPGLTQRRKEESQKFEANNQNYQITQIA